MRYHLLQFASALGARRPWGGGAGTIAVHRSFGGAYGAAQKEHMTTPTWPKTG